MSKTLPTIVMGLFLLLPNFVLATGISSSHPAQTQQETQSSPPAAPQNQAQSQGKNSPAVKPCSGTRSASSSQSDCKAASSTSKGKKRPAHKAAQTAGAAAGKTVVNNGGTGEPSMAISSGEGQRQDARIQETNRLLAAADLNLKDVAVRGLNANQEITVKQIRSYMDQAKAAENSGDVERAYNLANKANMLAADLNGR